MSEGLDSELGAAERPSGALSRAEAERAIAAVPNWHHQIHFPNGLVSPGVYDPRDTLRRLQLGDLRGKRVLDIGARDGFFSFACEQLGAAEVIALDHSDLDLTGFEVSRRLLGCRARYVQANVYELSPQQLGQFDVVLFLGVLYHLRHPLLALDRVRSVCSGRLLAESLVCDARVFTDYERGEPLAKLAPQLGSIPLAQFLPVGRYHRDSTNKWVPNTAGFAALLEDARFAVQRVQGWGDRALLDARAVEAPSVDRWNQLDSGLRGRSSGRTAAANATAPAAPAIPRVAAEPHAGELSTGRPPRGWRRLLPRWT